MSNFIILTSAQIKSYEDNGYLVIPSFLNLNEVENLLQETTTLLQSLRIETHPLTRFSTGESDNHVGDEYFLTSGSEIRFFFEEDAFDSQSGTLIKSKEQSVNKIGHNLHGLSPPFRSVTLSSKTQEIARSVGFRDPRVLQSMVICKQPRIGGAVPPHQDSTFLYTDPPSAVGFWIALEDATTENGCLSFAPGSHKRAPIKKRFVRREVDNHLKGTEFIDVDGGMWPRGEHGKESHIEEKYILEEVKAGDLVLIHGNVLHKSERNVSDKGRIIYTFHVIEGTGQYDAKNWLQVPGGPLKFTKLFEDLY